MQQVNIYRRVTNGYSDGWSHLDQWQHEGTLPLTPPQQVEQGNGLDQGGTYLQYARVPRGRNWRELARALEHTMGGSHCRHDYDCCGCVSRSVDVELIKPRRILVRTRVRYNY